MLVFFKLFISISVIFIMLGCGSTSNNLKPKRILQKPKADIKMSAIEDHRLMVINRNKKKELIENFSYNDKIQIYDKLNISVLAYPQLSTNPDSAPASKTIVNYDGTIQLPKLGSIYVVGMTVEELKKVITKKLEVFLLHPDVTVSIVYRKNSRYYLIGEFVNTTSVEKDYPLTLLELISEGAGIKLASADLRHAYVVRNNKKLPINLYRLIEKGDLSQNIDMKNRDTVVIPNNSDQFVYIFSDVTNGGSNQISFVDGKLTLTQALSFVKFSQDRYYVPDLKKVYVVRAEMDRIETFEINEEKILKGEALPFALAPGDAVYVGTANIGTINQVISYILPSLSIIQDTLADINSYRIIIDPLFLK